MQLRALQILVEVVRQQGFSAAARKINATQSTVSKAIKQLEDELGVVLIDRSVSHLQLTTAGEIVYVRAISMLGQADDLRSELDELKGMKRGLLRLGLPPIGSSLLFAPVLADFTKRFPNIDIQLVEHGSKRLEEMVLSGELELAASLLPVSEQFEWQDVRREPLVALVPANLPTDSQQSVSLDELATFPFILFEAGFALNPIILQAFRASGFDPRIAVRSSQIDFIIQLVAAGMGVGFLPRMIAEQRKAAGVRILTIRDIDLHWHMALVWRQGAFLTHAARAWLERCRQMSTITNR